jgi:uncharacterized protein
VEEVKMQSWRRGLVGSVAIVFVLGVVLLALALVFSDFIVDLWWFDALGYGLYFWQRLLYRYVIFTLATLLFFTVFFLNFRIASRFLSTTAPTDSRFERLRTRSQMIYFPLSLILGIAVALPLFYKWEAVLFYLFGPSIGVEDPAYGNDIGYYLFSLPIYQLLIRELLIAFIILLLGLAGLYWLENRLLSQQGRPLPYGAKVHLSVLIVLIFLIAIGDFILQRHLLLYTENHTPLFYGPGFVEMNVTLPLIWASLLFLMGVAYSAIFFIHTHKGLKTLITFAVGFFIVLAGRYSPIPRDLVQAYLVKPNAIDREAPYIANNIQATLAAYDLKKVETRFYPIKDPPWDTTTPEVQISLQNIPVWDREVLDDVYNQLQSLRPYYTFPSVDVDRYTIDGIYQQIFVSPREINLKALPQGTQTWVNTWLQYTHGYGTVMTPAAQAGEEPMRWLIQGIPPESVSGLSLKEPGIYYGLESYNPVIAPNESHEVDYPVGNTLKLTDYKGQGGVAISNLFRKLVFALYFKESNVFFTTKTNNSSRILFRRNIIERIQTLTPFLGLDQDPYVVIAAGKVYWIQDAYTYSDWYPYSQPYEKRFNYVRNAVKIVVDAYHGTVDYYIADPRDPIIQAYSRIYPTLFKALDRMPAELKSHVRYPKDLFDIQMSLYSAYHQTDPRIFYKQEDVWEFPKIHKGKDARTLSAYYVTLNLIDRKRFEFILLTPMNPKGRDNLHALAVSGCDGDDYGKIIVYTFPKGRLVYGPSQVDALINQDTTITQRFALWDQARSEVHQGKMIMLPIEGVIVYIQPVYLQSTAGSRIPQLQRVIVSQGQLVVMEPSLKESFEALNKRTVAEDRQLKQPLQQLKTPRVPSGVTSEASSR